MGKIEWVVAQPERKKGVKKEPPKPTVLDLARAHNWDAKVVGRGGMINKPVETNGWLVMRLEDYKGNIPPEALEKMEEVKKKCNVEGFLIADDLRSDKPAESPASDIILKIVLAVVAVIAIGILMIPILMISAALMGALGGALYVDPLLIAVDDESGEWISLFEWWE
jgi:hypothetical protein